MAKIRWRQKVNVNRAIIKIVGSILGLYVGGQLLYQLGQTMQCSYSQFYNGLSLIGWTIASSVTVVNSTVPTVCNTADSTLTAGTYYNVITSTDGSGILAVIGIVLLASIITEFVQFSL